MAHNDYAIVVGINDYPFIGSLEGAERDATDFMDWLIDVNGGAVPRTQIFPVLTSDLRNDPPDDPLERKPTCEDVQRFLNRIQARLDAGPRLIGRRLYLFFAGHGIATSSPMDDGLRNHALLMANAAAARYNLHIATVEYANWFAAAGAFEEVVLFVDACRDARPLVHSTGAFPPRISPPAAHLFIGLAAGYGGRSREGKSKDGHVRGYFTQAIIAGLRGGAADPEGAVLPGLLEDFVTQSVAERIASVPGVSTADRPEFRYLMAGPLVEGVSPGYVVHWTPKAGTNPVNVQLLSSTLAAVPPLPTQAPGVRWRLPSFGLYLLEVDGEQHPIKAVGEAREIHVSL